MSEWIRLEDENADLKAALAAAREERDRLSKLATELAEFALDAAYQGGGFNPKDPTWHSFISTWEDADELFRRPDFLALLNDEQRAALAREATDADR